MRAYQSRRWNMGRVVSAALPAILVPVGIGIAVMAATGAEPPAGAPETLQERDGFEWFWTLKGPVSTEAGNDMVADEQGNIFLAGYHGGLDLDRDGTVELVAADADPLFMKLSQRADDRGVTVEWTRAPSSPGFHKSTAIAADHRGGAYALGRFRETLTFESGLTVKGGGQNDAFLARYGTDGDLLWVRPFGGPGQDALFDVASDRAGNAYSVGFGSGPFPLDDRGTLFPATREPATLVASWDPEGAVRWMRVIEGPARAYIVEVAPNGEVFIVMGGDSDGTVDFDGDGTPDLPAPSDRDGIIARYSAEGDFLGAWPVGAGPGKIAFTASGDIILLGLLGGPGAERYGPADFDGDQVADVEVKGGGPTSAWVARYAADGRLGWVRSYTLQSPTGLATDGERIVVTGSYHGVRDLDEDGVAERVDRTVDPSEESELAILIIAPEDGRVELAWTAPGPGRDVAAAAVFLPGQPIVFVTGYIQLTADFTGDGEYGEGWAKCEELGDLFFARYRLGERRVPDCAMTLQARARRVEGRRTVDLAWSGAASGSVDVYRNGELVTTLTDRSAWVDTIPEGVSGRLEYTVRPAGGTACVSNAATVEF